MANYAALDNPQISDREAFEEYRDNLEDLLPSVEQGVARLKRAPQDRAAIADLFRALHTLKGDAAICQLTLGVTLLHPLESLLARMRNGEIRFSDVLAEVILLTADRLELAVEALHGGRTIEHLKLPVLVRHLDALAESGGTRLEDDAIHLIKDVTGFQPSSVQGTVRPGTSTAVRASEHIAEDLRFFQQLAQRLDERSPLFHGRNGRLLRLALDTNAAAGNPVDPMQLEAAVHMHDIGMMFMPDAAWNRPGHLSDFELALLREHPAHASGILARMQGWQEAAAIVFQHQEKSDGSGYPAKLRDAEICAGAKLLAIVDAFESITQKHANRGQGRSLLRAIAEINACDHQFSPQWIAYFNAVVRRRIER